MVKIPKIFFQWKSQAKLMIAFALSSHLCEAQFISPDIVATSGDYFLNTNYSVAWTLGEAMGETYSSATNFLTQGFQQPDYKTLTFTESANSEMNIITFPNPVINDLSISFGNNKGIYLIKVFDVIGNLLLVNSFSANSHSSCQIPFRNYSSGVYLLQIINNSTFSKSSYSIVKVGE